MLFAVLSAKRLLPQDSNGQSAFHYTSKHFSWFFHSLDSSQLDRHHLVANILPV